MGVVKLPRCLFRHPLCAPELTPILIDTFHFPGWFSRLRVSQWFSHLAQVSFALMLVTTPFRLRSVLVSRPVPPIYSDYTDVLFFISDGFLLEEQYVRIVRID